MGKNTTSRAARRKAARRRQRNKRLWIIIIVLLVLMGVTGCMLKRRYAPTKEMADRKSYFHLTDPNAIGLVCGKTCVENGAVEISGKLYLACDKLSEYVGPVVYIDSKTDVLRYVTPETFIEVQAGKAAYTENGKEKAFDEPVLEKQDKTYYLSYRFVKEKTHLAATLYHNPDRIVLDRGEERPLAKLKEKSAIRIQTGVKSPVLTEKKKGAAVFVGEQIDSWTEVMTEDGYRGYVETDRLGKAHIRKAKAFYPMVKPQKRKAPVRLAWDIMTNTHATEQATKRIASLEGVNVLSPTWASPKDVSGNLILMEQADYVKAAHKKGLDVWMLVSDFDFGAGGIKTPEETEALLRSNASRDRFVQGIVQAALEAGADGINVDFEHVYTESAGNAFAELIKELSRLCHQKDLVLSVDNYVPQPYNMQYHRNIQGLFADYVVIMGYDEHVDASENPGPVDSLPFVKKGIADTLKEVPKEKVINAVPFYTRIWEQNPEKQGEAGWFKGLTCGMQEAQTAVEKSGAKKIWDDRAAAYHAVWTGSAGLHYEVWIQDEKSLSMRLAAAEKADIAGIAGWRIGYEEPFVWKMFEKWKK